VITERTVPFIFKYLRPDKRFPTVWCPGCGIGIVMRAILRAKARLDLDPDRLAMVSGIGCAGRMPVYADCCTLHTTHGRALSYATGIKLVRPEMKVLAVMGDGDALGIGGNHFIHSARRNIDLTAIVINNQIYALTGGQCSPATPTGGFSTTSVYGNVDQPFDISAMAMTAGAAFVARTTVFHVTEMEEMLVRAIDKTGFSVVEVLSNCHTHFGKLNRKGSAIDMIRWYKEHTVLKREGEEPDPDKIVRGVLIDRDLPDYYTLYQQMLERARKEVDSQ